jgi:hypothetical protein
MPPKYLPPFSWGLNDECAFDKFIATAEIAMKRRGIPLNASQKAMLQRAWEYASRMRSVEGDERARSASRA